MTASTGAVILWDSPGNPVALLGGTLLLGFSAYIYLLHHTRPALATSYAYVNPPVAVFIGVVLGGEAVSRMDILGTVIIVAGVAAITMAKRAKSAWPGP